MTGPSPTVEPACRVAATPRPSPLAPEDAPQEPQPTSGGDPQIYPEISQFRHYLKVRLHGQFCLSTLCRQSIAVDCRHGKSHGRSESVELELVPTIFLVSDTTIEATANQ